MAGFRFSGFLGKKVPCISTRLYSMISEENDGMTVEENVTYFQSTTGYFSNGRTFEVDVVVHIGRVSTGHLVFLE